MNAITKIINRLKKEETTFNVFCHFIELIDPMDGTVQEALELLYKFADTNHKNQEKTVINKLIRVHADNLMENSSFMPNIQKAS